MKIHEGGSGFETDPIERDPQYADAIREADKLAREELADDYPSPRLGYCHVLWSVKKRILKERFGITWRSPADKNPHVNFD